MKSGKSTPHCAEFLSEINNFSPAGKCVNVVNTKGENINICWSPDGNTIAVGNKVCQLPIHV